MKRIDEQTVRHIADLSKLRFDEQQLRAMGDHLDAVLEYFGTLKKLNTDSVPPTAHILDTVNVLRDDCATTQPFPREALLQNAPERNEECYVVPRVVE